MPVYDVSYIRPSVRTDDIGSRMNAETRKWLVRNRNKVQTNILKKTTIKYSPIGFHEDVQSSHVIKCGREPWTDRGHTSPCHPQL